MMSHKICPDCGEKTYGLRNYNQNWKRMFCTNCGKSIPIKKNQKCKWTGKQECRYVDSVRVYTNAHVEPFELCEGPKREIPGYTYWFNDETNKKSILTAPSSCQPTTMGYGSKEEFMKDKINDKNLLTHYF